MSNWPPTLTQQRALAYAPKPLGCVSFLASAYLIYHLTVEKPQKCKRMYHRLVMAMSIADVPLAISWIWGNWAVPVGTPDVVGARGSIQTCNVQGFMNLWFVQAVPIYYASLGIYSYFAVKNSFRQEKFKWIEKWIHTAAWVLPLVQCFVILARESFNPRGTGCFIAASPLGCDKNPEQQCERGGDLPPGFLLVFSYCKLFICLIIPPLVMMLTGCWIRKAIKEAQVSEGMEKILISARKLLIQDVVKQIGLYLLAFMTAYVCPVTNGLIERMTGLPNVTLMIVGNCLMAFQGAILAFLYFTLQRMTTRNCTKRLAALTPGLDSAAEKRADQITVSKIRTTVDSKDILQDDTADEESEDDCVFFIFDGKPSDDSPWAKYIDQDDNDEEN